jgi:hypothetical protein
MGSSEEEEEGVEIKELREQLTVLKLKLNNMDERTMAEQPELIRLNCTNHHHEGNSS